jgi:arylsulfatase
VLQLNGYATAWLGKNHVTPKWETGPQGPFDRWPNGLGLDYFYGFMGGATYQWDPVLVENRNPVEPPRDDPDYILDRDLADHAIGWIRQHRATDPQRPFFLYLASGTAHVPLQAPRAWIERFRGQFDAGWDAMRVASFERQKRLGVIPAEAQLTPRPATIPAWDSLTREAQAVAARLMEVHAAQLAYFDEQFGRIVGELERLGLRDDTLIVYIDGDNGPSGESGVTGTSIEGLNGASSSIEHMSRHLHEMGGRRSFDGYPVGWAWAMATPFQYTKQVASHLGGTRDGLVVSWPKRIGDGAGCAAGSCTLPISHRRSTSSPALRRTRDRWRRADVLRWRELRRQSRRCAGTLASSQPVLRDARQPCLLRGQLDRLDDDTRARTLELERPGGSAAFRWELMTCRATSPRPMTSRARRRNGSARLKAQFEQAAARNQVRRSTTMPRGCALTAHEALPRPMSAPCSSTTAQAAASDGRVPGPEEPLVDAGGHVCLGRSAANSTLITQGGWQNSWGLFVFEGAGRRSSTGSTRCPATPGDSMPPLPGCRRAPRACAAAACRGGPGAGATVTLAVDEAAPVSRCACPPRCRAASTMKRGHRPRLSHAAGRRLLTLHSTAR